MFRNERGGASIARLQNFPTPPFLLQSYKKNGKDTAKPSKKRNFAAELTSDTGS
jgi:hypothetical protein